MWTAARSRWLFQGRYSCEWSSHHPTAPPPPPASRFHPGIPWSAPIDRRAATSVSSDHSHPDTHRKIPPHAPAEDKPPFPWPFPEGTWGRNTQSHAPHRDRIEVPCTTDTSHRRHALSRNRLIPS